MDVVVYALLKKRITSALSGVKDIKLKDNNTILFTTNDGQEFEIDIPTPDFVHVGEDEPAKDSDYELWVDTSTDGSTSLNRAVLEEAIVASTEIGSVKKGKVYPIGTNLETIIREMLTSYSKPVIVITPNPAADLYDAVEDTLESIITKAKITKGTEYIKSISFYVNQELDMKIEQDASHDIKNGGTFESSHTFDPATNETFTLKVTVNDGKENTTAQKVITFIGKSYFGVLTGGDEIDNIHSMTEEGIKALQNNTLKNSRNLYYQDIKMDYGKIVYAYPKSLGPISNIVDQDGRNFTASYDINMDIEIDGIPYYYCMLKNAVGSTVGINQKFS